MATTGITNAFNSRMRLTGMASGLDTDTLIKQMMAKEQAKLDKVLAKRQIDLWKTDAYREATSTLQSFYKDYFDTLSSKNLKSANNFASFSATYSATNSTDYIAVTPGANAKIGNYTITEMTMAKAALLTSSGNTGVTGGVVGLGINKNFLKDPNGPDDSTNWTTISSANNNNVISITFNNVTKKITLPDSSDTLNSLAIDTTNPQGGYLEQIQSAIDSAFGMGKISVGNSIDGIKFTTVRTTDSFQINSVYNNGASDLFSAKPTEKAPFTVGSDNNKFKIKVGADEKTVTVAYGIYESAGALATAIQTAVNAAFGSPPATAPDITFSGEAGVVTYTSGTTVSVNKLKIDANSALGLDPTKTAMGNKVDLKANLFDTVGSFKYDTDGNQSTDADKLPLSFAGTANDIEFTINGKYFRFNSKNTSLNDIMRAVNADTSINVSMTYDATSDRFTIASKSTGATSRINVSDKTGHLMSALGINLDSVVNGNDASIKIKGLGGSTDEVEIVRATNSFSYDGINFNIKQNFKEGVTQTDPIKFAVVGDTTKTYDYIKTFVEKYNEVIGKLNDKIGEEVYRNYTPLTDEQKEAMSEDQIEKWEEKAKSGLLKNDSIISSTLSQLRSALYAAVEGTGITLSSIGITTSSNYEDKGKLIIDEDKLKNALANKPLEVANLFTSTSDITYYESINNSKLRSQRYKESGIAQRFSDIIQDAIRTNTDNNGYKGTLLEKAGMIGDRSQYLNTLYKEIKEFDSQITEMNKRLLEKENALYEKFAKMESAMEKMNSQQSWLTQQFGGGS